MAGTRRAGGKGDRQVGLATPRSPTPQSGRIGRGPPGALTPRIRRVSAAVMFAILAAACFGAARAEDVLARAGCAEPTAVAGMVAAVGERGTLVLADGRVVRLAGVEIAAPADAADAEGGQFAVAAAELVTRLAVGAELRLPAQPGTDRYGRISAQIRLSRPGEAPAWPQSALVDAGLARVIGAAHERDCLAELLVLEREARAARRGLWSGEHGRVFAAGDPSLSRRTDLYRLVEGRVLSLGRTSGAVYLNFGRDWSTDFTAVILTPDAARFAEASVDLDRLDGARVRIRGWLTLRNGPTIRVDHPEQIEILDDDERDGGAAGGR